ncbi:hypothetical protein GCM10022278_33620 [Allohahella marinimesophila]|uniref:AAA domain-containing protein n=1 Tax=Allohahella marinimesophila TaxID=1054972 RepID=A0ABP7PZ22_9GAMM
MREWHYPRNDLTRQYLGLLELGITSSLAITAPRRRGKTLFILQDLAPLAQKSHYIPVYASLWQNINAPHEGLALALKEAIAALDKKATFSRLLKARVTKTTISNELLGKMEVEFSNSPSKPTSAELAELDQLLSALEEKAGKSTILLLIDEVQHLATTSQFDPLAHALRTMLDRRQGRVKSIFTGSSRHYLNLLLNESKSPFYHFVEQHDFPDLDEQFIHFLRAKLANDHGMAVAIQPLMKAFSDLDQSPYWMMKLIARMITFKATTNEALDHVLLLMEAAEDFEGVASRLKPIDRLIFQALCEGANPFSQSIMARVDRETKLKGVQPNIQRAIRRLSEAGLISQSPKGRYNIEKPGLKRYLQQS